jgi:hypothetical protein
MVVEIKPLVDLALNNGRKPFFRLKLSASKLQSIQKRIHRCKNRFSRSGRFCYDSASTSPSPLAHRAVMVAQPLCELPALDILFFFRKLTKVCGQFFCGSGISRKWLCDYWHFAAFTAPYANELKSES